MGVHDIEKPVEMVHLDDIAPSGEKTLNDGILTSFTPQQQKRILRRIDRRLVAMAGLMYCISILDRTNIGNASIAGLVKVPRNPSGSGHELECSNLGSRMTKDLNLRVGTRYVR